MTTPRSLLLCALLVAACQREEVTHFRIAKAAPDAPSPTMAAAGMGAPMGGGSMDATTDGSSDLEPAKPSSGLGWTLPKGWTQEVAGGMRYATIKPAAKGDVEVSVVVLPGTAGGELANVNRWRGQLGIEPLDEKAAGAARTVVKTKAGPFALYDFTGAKKNRMVAALAVLDGNTWFLKMLGDPRTVGSTRAEFIHLLEGVHVQ
jgi:hypothetical protein